MAKKIRKVGKPYITDNPEGGVFVSLPSAIRNNREVLRWLHHWVVDALAQRGYLSCMVADVEDRLAHLGVHLVGTSVSDLVRQALEATSEPEESPASKKAKKGKGK